MSTATAGMIWPATLAPLRSTTHPSNRQFLAPSMDSVDEEIAAPAAAAAAARAQGSTVSEGIALRVSLNAELPTCTQEVPALDSEIPGARPGVDTLPQQGFLGLSEKAFADYIVVCMLMLRLNCILTQWAIGIAESASCAQGRRYQWLGRNW